VSNGGSKFRYLNCDCGLSHRPEDRLARLRRILPEAPSIIAKRFPCTYPNQTDGVSLSRTLYRDLRAIGAKRIPGQSEWNTQEKA
jgi:hypothetical protein